MSLCRRRPRPDVSFSPQNTASPSRIESYHNPRYTNTLLIVEHRAEKGCVALFHSPIAHTHPLAEYRSSLHNTDFEILIQILRFSGRKQLVNNHNAIESLTILTDLAGSRVGGRWIVTCRRGSIRAGRGLWDFVRLGPIRVPLTALGMPRYIP